MSLSTKPRHWIALVIAAATMVVGILAFIDFSGEPPPRWRDIFMLVGPGLTVAAIVLNIALDRRDSGRRE